MSKKSKAGFSLVDLVVVVGVLFVLAFALSPSISNAPMQANMTAVGARGRDIYVAITGANTERKALGMPSLWPRDFDPAVDANAEELAQLDTDTSTAYFKWLADEENVDTPQWSPYVAGFDYTKLAGAGVRVCPKDQKLSAERNMWTIAKNVRDGTDDIVPVLVTRNIEASSLAARVDEPDFKAKALRFDPSWPAPFGDQGFVLIRKGGAIFKARPKYMSYRVVYQQCAFDTARTTNGVAGPPLKYLTPTREVTPGDQAYADGAVLAYQLAGGRRGQIKRDVREIAELYARAGPFAFFFAVVYLAVFADGLVRRKSAGHRPLTSAPVIGVWICHCLSLTFYTAGIVCAGLDKTWVYAATAVAAQAGGVVLALVFQRHDRETRRRQIKWLLTPLWIVLAGAILAGFLMLAPSV